MNLTGIGMLSEAAIGIAYSARTTQPRASSSISGWPMWAGKRQAFRQHRGPGVSAERTRGFGAAAARRVRQYRRCSFGLGVPRVWRRSLARVGNIRYRAMPARRQRRLRRQHGWRDVGFGNTGTSTQPDADRGPPEDRRRTPVPHQRSTPAQRPFRENFGLFNSGGNTGIGNGGTGSTGLSMPVIQYR